MRSRKKAAAAAAQRFVPIADVRSDTLLLKNGGLRAVLRVEPVNVHLKSEDEQKAITAGYQSFVNTLDFPIQVVVRSRRVDVSLYARQLEDRAEKQSNELLKQQTLGYTAFVKKIVDVADIMEKRFYVIIPLDSTIKRSNPLQKFFQWLKLDDTPTEAFQRTRALTQNLGKLRDRVTTVESGLNSIGLQTKRLTTADLLSLTYESYNPGLANHQKLPVDLNAKPMTI